MSDQIQTQEKIIDVIQKSETFSQVEKDILIQKIQLQFFTHKELEKLLQEIQVQENRRHGPWIQEKKVQKKYLSGYHSSLPIIKNPSEEKESLETQREIQPIDLNFYEQKIQSFKEIQNKFGIQKATQKLETWIQKHPDFALLRFLDLFLLSTLVEDVESIHRQPTFTEEGYTKRMYTHIYVVLDRLQNRAGGKPFVIFYLRSLYTNGVINKNHPLFDIFISLDSSFIEKEQQGFESQQKELTEKQDQLKKQWNKEKEKSTKQKKNKLWLQQKLLSAQQTNILLDRCFPREWADLQLRIIEAHTTLNNWNHWGGSEAERIKRDTNEKLEELQIEWFNLIQKLEDQNISIPTYTNPEDESHCILSPVIGREIDVRSGRIIKTDEEFWKDMGLLALDFVSIVTALYTAGLGAAAMRTLGKKVLMNAFVSDLIATTIVSGTIFSVSSKMYQNILKMPWQTPDWSSHNLLKDIPKDILLFSVLRGITLKYDSQLKHSIQRFPSLIKQTSITAGTLIGFTQTERIRENLYEGKSLKKSVIHNIQELPADILLTLGFLMGLQGVQFTLTNISTKKGETNIEQKIIEYSADKNDIILGTLQNFVGKKNVQELGNGKIRVDIEGKEILFERIPMDIEAIKQRKKELLEQRPEEINIGVWRDLLDDYPEFDIFKLKKVYEIEKFLKNNEIKNYIQETINSMDINTVKILQSSPKDIIAYRFYGNSSSQFSYYYVPTDIRFIPFFEIADILALPDKNSIERVAKVIIPKGSPMIIGEIAHQKLNWGKFTKNKFGGGKQIYYPLKDKNVIILEDWTLNDLRNGKLE